MLNWRHVKPAAKLGIVVFAVCTATDIVANRYSGRHWAAGFVADVVAAALTFMFFLLWSRKHLEDLSAVDAWKANAFLIHLKVNNALTKLHQVNDLCHHGDHSPQHEHCKAVMRQQLRVIYAATGRGPAPVENAKLEREIAEQPVTHKTASA